MTLALVVSIALSAPSSMPASMPVGDAPDFDELPIAPTRPSLRAPPPPPPAAAFEPPPPPPPVEDIQADTTTRGSLFQMKPIEPPSSSSPATAPSEERTASSEDKMRKGELSMLGVTEFLNDQNFAGLGIGYYNLDSVQYVSATPLVDLHFFDKKLHLNLGNTINFTLFDPNNGGFSAFKHNPIRAQDWNAWYKWVRLIRRIQWGRKEDHFFARLGTVGATSIGHGGLMRRYNNNMLANTSRLGFEVDAYNDYVGGEAFVSDVTFQQSRVLGGLGFVKPLGWMESPMARSLSIGATYAGDLAAPTSLKRENNAPQGVVTTDSIGNPLYNTTAVNGVGASVEFKPVRIGDMIDIKIYGEFNQLLKYGNGFTGGVLGRFNLTSLIALRARIEGRAISAHFIPSYFDTFYEIQKLQMVTFNPSSFAPTKLDFLQSLNSTGYKPNIYAEVTFSLIDKFAVSAAYEAGANALLQSFLLHAEFSAFDWLRFFATYHKRNFTNFHDLFGFQQQNDLLYAQLRIEVLPILFINGRAVRTFLWDPNVDFGLGGLSNVWDFRVNVELGWQW